MKVLFLYPNADSQVGFNYGVSHMAAMLRKAGHDVTFWQLCEQLAPLPGRDEFINRVKREKPDVLAFSVVTNQWEYAKKLASWIKQDLSITTICGGVHALVAPEQILDSGVFDYIMRGECEEAFPEFVEHIDQNQSVDDLQNLGYRKDGRIYLNPVRPLPVLESLPFKDYEVMDFQKLIDVKNGWVGLMASRGCPFSCTYCFNHKMVATYRADLKCSFAKLHYIRRFPVEQMAEEIRYLLKNYRNIRMFIFDDDLFTFDKNYVKEFCAAYKKITDLPFVVNAHVRFFDQECADILTDANCRIVKFGVESGSERVRKTILNRYMSNEEIIEAIRYVREAGMHSSTFVIIGFPHEKSEDVFATIRLLAQASPGRFRWTYFFPYPGTEAHRISQESGLIDEEKMRTLSNFTDQSCLDFGDEQNLLLRKIGRIMPWFVNAYSNLSAAPIYQTKIDELLGLDKQQWEHIEPTLYKQDKKLSEKCVREGLSHYAIKYNRFMGVISDYFLQEE
jgi:anaerobic magnesium-protoporphyrin IX monomethyl ester cyclase